MRQGILQVTYHNRTWIMQLCQILRKLYTTIDWSRFAFIYLDFLLNNLHHSQGTVTCYEIWGTTPITG